MPILSTLYGFVFALSLIWINPWGVNRGEIWTEPKVTAVSLITLLNCLVILEAYRNRSLVISSRWKVGLRLWAVFTGVGLASTLLSPFPGRSLWGQSVLGDGWIYWVLIGTFVLSNALVLQLHPTLFRSQLYGLLAGGLITALSIFPQIIDWRIDYTITSGQVNLFNSQRLESTVWQSHMPIGLCSNRGHTAFILATTATLSLLSAFWKWINTTTAALLCLTLAIGLLFTETRSGMLAFLIATAYLVLRFHFRHPRFKTFFLPVKQLVKLSYFGIAGYIAHAAFAVFSKNEIFPISSVASLENLSSGRLHLFNLALKGIAERPFLGWGFNGFGIAFPMIADWTGSHKGYLIDKVPIHKIHRLNDFTFDYIGTDKSLHFGIIFTNKAHNLLLDTTLSVGIAGLISYFILLVFFVWSASMTEFRGIEAILLVYLIYTFFWFESAQFSHLLWWALSIGATSRDCNYGLGNESIVKPGFGKYLN